jgi:hypothetical protein
MPRRKESASFLFSLTLTEVAFLMAFLFLLLAAPSLELRGAIETSPGIADTDTVIQDAQLLQQLKEAGIDVENLAELERIGGLSPVLLDMLKRDDGNWHELVMRTLTVLVDKDSLLDSGQIDIIQVNEGLSYDDLLNQIEQLEKQLAGMESDLVVPGNGLDNPACWPNEGGSADYIFNVTLRDEVIKIANGSPPSRQNALQDIPGAVDLSGKTYTFSAFVEQTRPLLEWSREQKERGPDGCRHLVRVLDDTTGKDEYKNALRTVEQVFYKFEVEAFP